MFYGMESSSEKRSERRVHSNHLWSSAILILAFPLHLAAAVVGDGFVALPSHLFGARLYLDLLIATGIYRALGPIAGQARLWLAKVFS